jgi:mitogen-activated protein kinase kinase kinase
MRGPRPQGARRRGIAPGLFIANPDNSDEDGSSPRSTKSPVRSSPVRTSPATASTSGSSGRAVPIPQTGSPLNVKIPSIPAPQSSPLPTNPGFVLAQPDSLDRHYRRAQTTPMDQPVRPTPEPRISGPLPHSPTRALPPLPSPPFKSASPLTTFQPAHPLPTPPPSYPLPATPYPRQPSRIDSPETLLSPDNSRSYIGPGDGSLVSRGRSGSVTSSKIVVQVTTDNESFTTVDITGMHTAEGIKERVFSKVSDPRYFANGSFGFVMMSIQPYRSSAQT